MKHFNRFIIFLKEIGNIDDVRNNKLRIELTSPKGVFVLVSNSNAN